MKLEHLAIVTKLQADLSEARKNLRNATAYPGATVPVTADCSFAYGRGAFKVALLPVQKEVVVSAAARAVSKIIGELQQLGVEVDHQPSEVDVDAERHRVQTAAMKFTRFSAVDPRGNSERSY